MYMKTNLKEDIKTYVNKLEVNKLENNLDDLYLRTYLNIRNLSTFIDMKIKEFKINAPKNEEFKLQAEWLEDWKNDRKRELFIDIEQVVSLNNLKDEKLIKLNKRIERYFKYFDLIDEESDKKNKYEEMFNTIIQVPSEIYSFIKDENLQQSGKFMKNEYNYSNNIVSPSISIEGDILKSSNIKQFN